MSTLRTLTRSAALAIALALALGCSTAAFAGSPPPAVKLTLKAPIAVRKGAAFTMRGSAGAAASAGETVTVTWEHKGGSWSVVSTAAVALSSSRAFSLKLTAAARGAWRVSASLPGTSAHLPSSASMRIKAVGKKVIALTFDDGPWPVSTAKIVSELKAADVQATFFELGSQIGSRKKLSQSVIAGGNVIGVHSWNHAIMVRRSASVNKADLAKCKKAVFAATGVTPTWFRPPYGSTNQTLRKTAEKLGLRQVIWTVDTLDWKYRTTSSVVSRTMSGARDGSVVLMHDGGGPRGATAAAVPIVIKKLRAKGYDFATLDEMVALGYKVR
jgi:peptidoglycan/xylan/chitin deacetylase (PgdA/CDA1 family)